MKRQEPEGRWQLGVWGVRWAAAISLLLAPVLASCGRSPREAPPTTPAAVCPSLEVARKLQAEGYLHRALAGARESDRGCSSPASRWLIAQLLDDLGRDRDAIAAYRLAATDPGAGDRASAAIDRIGRRPPLDRAASAEELRAALLLYRDGVNLRISGDHDRALTTLRRSYATKPHPLTVVQIGQVHAAAGRSVEARRANARALAIAEEMAGVSAVPELRRGHASFLLAAGVTARGRQLVSISADGGVRLWDAASGRAAGSFETGIANRAIISPTGELLATADRSQVALWDVATGGCLFRRSAGENQYVTAIAFDHDGRRLAIAASDRSLLLLAASTGELLTRLDDRPSRAIAFSQDGKLLATISPDGVVVVTGDGGAVQAVDPATRADWIGFGAEQRLLLVDQQQTVTGWSLATGSVLFRRPGRAVTAIALSPDGRQLAVSRDGKVEITGLDGGVEPVALGVMESVRQLSFAPAGRLLLITDHPQLWDLASATRIHDLRGPTSRITALAHDPADGRLAAAGKQLTVWDLTTGKPATTIDQLARNLSLEFAGSDAIVAINRRGRPALYHPATGAMEAELDHEDAETVAYNSVKQLIATASFSGRVLVWRRDGTKLAELASPPPRVFALRFTADGDELAIADGQGITMWRPATGATRRLAAVRPQQVAAAPDGSLLAAADDDGAIELLPLSGGTRRSLAGHDERTSALQFSPNGELLASASGDRTAALWRVASGKRIATMSGHSAWIDDLCFLYDGDRLATAGADGTILFWGIPGGDNLATAVASDDGEWLVIAGSAVDGSDPAAGPSFLYWQVGEFQLPGFVGWQRQYRPGLLAERLQ